jgi:hypothetical protein
MFQAIRQLSEFADIVSNFDYLDDNFTTQHAEGSLHNHKFTIDLVDGYIQITTAYDFDLVSMKKLLKNLEKLQTLLTLKSPEVLAEQV